MLISSMLSFVDTTKEVCLINIANQMLYNHVLYGSLQNNNLQMSNISFPWVLINNHYMISALFYKRQLHLTQNYVCLIRVESSSDITI